MAERLKEENSFTRLNNLRKWLDFVRMKSEMMLKLIKQFNNNEYAFVRNVYKFMLMFLSISGYISKMNGYVNEIKARKIKTPDGDIVGQDIISKHESQFQTILKIAASYFEQLI
jgi:glycogen synthase